MSENCRKICPTDCRRDVHFFTNCNPWPENNNRKVLYTLWDSREAFISYEETADMLLLDYFTYIGGLFGLWFCICLESLLDLIVKHTTNLRTTSVRKTFIIHLLFFDLYSSLH